MTVGPHVNISRASTASRRQRAADMTRAGHSAAEIATILGVSPRTVVRYRVAAEVAQPGPVVVWTPEVIAAAEAMVEDRVPAAEIARTLGIADTTVLARYPHAAWSRAEDAAHRRAGSSPS